MKNHKSKQLSYFEGQVFLKWRLLSPELWSRPDLYSLDQEKIINGIKKNGLSFVGFEKEKLFQYCLNILKRRELLENHQVFYASKVLSLIEKNGKKISHYSLKNNTVSVFEITLQDYYGNQTQDSFTSKLRKALDGKSFSSFENKLYQKVKFQGDTWMISNTEFENLEIYPEIEEYLSHTEVFTSIRIEISKLAETLPTLFEIGESEQKLLALKPCLLTNGADSFYLTYNGGHYNIVSNYEGFTTWKI